MVLDDVIGSARVLGFPSRSSLPAALAALATACCAAFAPASASAQEAITRISESGPFWGNNYSARDDNGGSISISADGRWVAFDSNATNLADLDVTGNPDPYHYANIFIREVATGRIVRITSANGYSWDPVLSGDGRFVAFLSNATDLIASDTNGTTDVYLHDRDPDGSGVFDEGNGTTTRVSLSHAGLEIHGDCSHPSISDDGNLVAFVTAASDVVSNDKNGVSDAFLRNVSAGSTVRVSVNTKGAEAKFGADNASVSPDGSVVAFQSYSGDIVSGDTNGTYDVFIYKVSKKATIERVSVDSNGNQGNGNSEIVPRCLSHDASIVVFSSTSDNLVAGDTNGRSDVFIRNRSTKQTLLASQSSGGTIGDFDSLEATIDAAGDRVAFCSDCTNFDSNDQNGADDAYVHDFNTGTTTLVSATPRGASGNQRSTPPLIAPAGDVVAFASWASDLVPNDGNAQSDVFLRDLARGRTSVVSALPSQEASGNRIVTIDDTTIDASADGRWIAFDSEATNLVPGDTNGVRDVFVKDRVMGTVVRVSVGTGGIEGDGPSRHPSISLDGRCVAFVSGADNWGWDTSIQSYAGNVFVCDRDPDGNGIFDEGNDVLELVTGDATHLWGGSFADPPTISGSGRYVAFLTEVGDRFDSRAHRSSDEIVAYDRVTGASWLVSVDPAGLQEGNGVSRCPAFSADDSVIVYESNSTNLSPLDPDGGWAVYAQQRATGVTTLVSVNSSGVRHGGGYFSLIFSRPVSGDGTKIVFMCNDPTFNPGKTTLYYDVYLRDLTTGITTDISTITGDSPDADCGPISISRDGVYVAFETTADNMLAKDANGASDIFWYDTTVGTMTCLSTDGADETADDGSTQPIVLEQSGMVLFNSLADNLIHSDTNQAPDVFLCDPNVVATGASWRNYGNGYPGTNGVPGLVLDENPLLGSTVTLAIGNSLRLDTLAVLVLGVQSARISTPYGATLLVGTAGASFTSLSVPATGLPLAGALPSDPADAGAEIFLQVLEADAVAAHGISFSRGLQMYLNTY